MRRIRAGISSTVKTKAKVVHLSPNTKKKMKAEKKQERSKKLKSSILDFRRRWRKQLEAAKSGKSESATKAKILLECMDERSETPSYICVSCERLLFRKSVVKAYGSEIENLKPENSKFDTNFICKSTCRKHFQEKKLPKLAVKNGFEYPDLPPELRSMTPLEERMVAPIINFMQIRPLMPHSLNPQLALKGSVVNVPVEVKEMVTKLPRRFDNMGTVQVKFKRHMDHAGDYMFAPIRTKLTLDVAEYLCKQDLYIKNGIKIDKSFSQKIRESQHYTEDFIVNPADRVVRNETNPDAVADVFSEERDAYKLLEKSNFDIADFFNDNNNDIDEVLLLDENFENAMNSIR